MEQELVYDEGPSASPSPSRMTKDSNMKKRDRVSMIRRQSELKKKEERERVQRLLRNNYYYNNFTMA